MDVDAAAPGLVGGALSDVRLTDREAILVRTDLPTSEFRLLGTGSATYGASISFDIAGTTVSSFRTYGFVDLSIGGLPLRVVSTHLEPAVAPVRLAQAGELVGALAGLSTPVIVLGDFNAPPASAAYATMIFAGFGDAWLATGLGSGFTCCQAADLLNGVSALAERVDHVFYRGRLAAIGSDVVGDELAGRTPSLRWPSDHAGVVATFAVVPEPGTLLLIAVSTFALGVRGRPGSRALRKPRRQ